MTTTAESGTHRGRLHDPAVRGFASDNYAGAHPEILAALAAANDGHQVAYGEDDYTARLQELMEATSAPASRLPGLQRHRRQRPGPAVAAPALGRGDLRRHRAHQHRRERRPGTDRRHKAAARPHTGRQAHPGTDRPRGLGLGRRAPGAAAGRIDHPDHRTGHLLHAGGNPGDRRARPREGHESAHGRRPAGQRGRPPGRSAAGLHHATPGWTSCPSAAPRTGCCSAKPSSCSTRRPTGA